LKSTETLVAVGIHIDRQLHFSNFGSLKSTETYRIVELDTRFGTFQQFRLVEEH